MCRRARMLGFMIRIVLVYTSTTRKRKVRTQLLSRPQDVLHVGVKRDPTNFSTRAMRVTFDFFSRPRRAGAGGGAAAAERERAAAAERERAAQKAAAWYASGLPRSFSRSSLPPNPCDGLLFLPMVDSLP